MMYYHCPKCGFKYEYALDMMVEFGAKFGYCPNCDVMGTSAKEGPRQKDDAEYFEDTAIIRKWHQICNNTN